MLANILIGLFARFFPLEFSTNELLLIKTPPPPDNVLLLKCILHTWISHLRQVQHGHVAVGGHGVLPLVHVRFTISVCFYSLHPLRNDFINKLRSGHRTTEWTLKCFLRLYIHTYIHISKLLCDTSSVRKLFS